MMGQAIPPMVLGVKNPNDHLPPKKPAAAQVKPRQPPPLPSGELATKLYCSLCDVWSGSAETHDTHLKGKRHKRMEMGLGAGPTIEYETPEIAIEQEMFKKQYVCLVREVLCYIKHVRGLVKAEFEYEKINVRKRINGWPEARLRAEGLAFFNATCETPGDKKGEVHFRLQDTTLSSPELLTGACIYVSPMGAGNVDIDNRATCMAAEVVSAGRERVKVKNIVGKNRRWVAADAYRIDLGVISVPAERMRQVLQTIKRLHLEKLRLLGIQDRIDTDHYFSDDGDTIVILESKVCVQREGEKQCSR
ncbi:hypothetical protein DIPPA_13107 [Diplonema papillatum]|nr:hypothetical protein DIPPA_13107 [Diplonema papillatum]